MIAVAGRGGGESHLGGGAVVVDAERAVVAGLSAGQRQVVVVVLQERRAEALALLRRHRAEQTLAERRRFRQHRGDVRVADRKLFNDDACGQRISADAAEILGQRQCAKPDLRGLAQHLNGQGAVAEVEAIGLQRDRLDLVLDEVPHRIAELQLLGT